MSTPRVRIIRGLDGDGRPCGWRVLVDGVWGETYPTRQAAREATTQLYDVSRLDGRLARVTGPDDKGGALTRYRILAGHPVPFSLTVQRVSGPRLLRLSPAARQAAEAYLAAHLPGASIVRVDGPYVFYALPTTAHPGTESTGTPE